MMTLAVAGIVGGLFAAVIASPLERAGFPKPVVRTIAWVGFGLGFLWFLWNALV